MPTGYRTNHPKTCQKNEVPQLHPCKNLNTHKEGETLINAEESLNIKYHNFQWFSAARDRHSATCCFCLWSPHAVQYKWQTIVMPMRQVITSADLHAGVNTVLQSGYSSAETSQTGERCYTKHGWKEYWCVFTYTNDVNKKNGLWFKNFKISKYDM
jgi:hypothetical protein